MIVANEDTEVTDLETNDEPLETEKTSYTKDEMEAHAKKFAEEYALRKLRGQGKALAERDAKIKAYEEKERKAVEAKKTTEQRAADLAAENEKLRSENETHRAAIVARKEAAAEKVAGLRKSLPKAIASAVPEHLDPEDQLQILGDLERLKSDKSVAVHGGGGRTAAEPVDPMDAAVKLMNDRINKRGVA